MPIGATRIQTSDDLAADLDRSFSDLDALSVVARKRALTAARNHAITHPSGMIDGFPVQALLQVLVPLPQILGLGARPDAVPVVQRFLALGW